MEEIIFRSEYFDLGVDRELESLREIWKIAKSPIGEFKKICHIILNECINYGIKNLILDTSGAVSMLPPEHQEWLSREFNQKILYHTDVKTVILISPENIVTKISTDLLYKNIGRGGHGILTLKINSWPEAVKWLNDRKRMEESKQDGGDDKDDHKGRQGND